VQHLQENPVDSAEVTVMPVPIFTMLKLDSSTRGVVAEANRWFCPTWTWCDFTIKDAKGRQGWPRHGDGRFKEFQRANLINL
jgi:hypothetical protein